MLETGRVNYDEAVGFCIGKTAAVAPPRFSHHSLPNIPKLPKERVPDFHRGLTKDGAYLSEYTVSIRIWNQFLASCREWISYIGTRRAQVICRNKKLFALLRESQERPDGTSKRWDENEALEWERAMQAIVHLYGHRRKGDIGTMKYPASWRAEYKRMTEQDCERHFGTIQARWKTFNTAKIVHSCESEEDMLRAWCAYMKEYDPDMVTGYNVTGFDLRYVIRRIRVLDLRDEHNSLITMGRLKHANDTEKPKRSNSRATGQLSYTIIDLPGRDTYDLLHYFQREYQLASFTLGSVSQHFLGDTKHDVPYSALFSLFVNNRERETDYCFKDAELPLMLIAKLNVFPFNLSLARLIGTVAIGRLFVDGKQAQLFACVFFYLDAEGLDKIFPDVNPYTSNSQDNNERGTDVRYEGAYVHPPVVGLILLLLLCIDYNALYPSIMRALNLGHDVMGTAAHFASLGIPLDKCYQSPYKYLDPFSGEEEYYYFVKPEKLTVDELYDNGYTLEECEEAGEKSDRNTGSKVMLYTPKIQVSALCGVIVDFTRARGGIKKKMYGYKSTDDEYRKYDAQQLGVKKLNNSLYGATGADGRLSAIMISAFTTWMGKKTITELLEKLKERYGAETKGGDTDSLFVHFPHITKLEHIYEEIEVTDPETGAKKTTTKIQEILDYANSLVPKPMEIDFEKAYSESFAVAKKRGAFRTHMPFKNPLTGKNEFEGEGKLTFKGLENMRRDSCPVAQKVFTGFLSRLVRKPLDTETEGDLLDDALTYVEGEAKKIAQGKIGFHELVQSRQLASDNYANDKLPHVQLCKKKEARGEVIPDLGSRIPFVVLSGHKKRKFYQKVEDPDYAIQHGLQPDLAYVLEKKIRNPIQRFAKRMKGGTARLDLIFNDHNLGVQKRNLLDDDALHDFVVPMQQCLNCGQPSYSSSCTACVTLVDWGTEYEKKLHERSLIEKQHAAAMKVCRACMAVGTDEEVLCNNLHCSEYYPRKGSEYQLIEKARELQDIEDCWANAMS